ncbi:hypothetical protein Tco_0613587 [Tanacetum coccineum]
METINVTFDELSAMAFEQHSSKPKLQGMTSRHISSGLDLTYASSTITSQKPTERTAPTTPNIQAPNASTTTADSTPTLTNSSSQALVIPNTSQDVDELQQSPQHNQQIDNQPQL